MSNNIENIIAKYLAGATSIEEEAQMKTYLLSGNVDPEHLDLVPLFAYYSSEEALSFTGNITASTILQKAAGDATVLLEKYFEGETTLGEEESLKAYFASDMVKAEHKEYQPLFSFFKAEESLQSSQQLDLDFMNNETPVHTLEPRLESKIENNSPLKSKTKVRRLIPRVAAVAASLAVLLMFTFSFFNESNQHDMMHTAEAEEALEVTMEALAYLGVNYDKGAQPMKHLKQLEKTNIFKFN